MLNLLRLSIAVAFENFWRFVISTMAITAAATIVLWMASTYHAIFQSFDDYAELAFGRYQLAVAPIDYESQFSVPTEAIDALRSDPRIEVVDTFSSDSLDRVDFVFSQTGDLRSRTHADESSRHEVPRGQLTYLFMSTESTVPPHPLVSGSWINDMSQSADTALTNGVVLREDIAKRWNLVVGDQFSIRKSQGTIDLQVHGIISATLLKGASSTSIHSLTPNQAECFVPRSIALRLFSMPQRISLAGVKVADGVDIHAFRFDWAHKLSQFEQPLQFQHAYELEEQLDQSATARSIQIQSYVAIAFSALLTAIATLWGSNLGLESKIQQLGMLRAIGFTRLQVAAVPVIEGILRGVLAWTLSIVIALAIQSLPAFAGLELFKHGISLQGGLWSAGSIFAGAIGAIFSQLRISIKVHPLDAIAVSGATSLAIAEDTSKQSDSPTSSLSKHWIGAGVAFALMIIACAVSSNKELHWNETVTALVVAFALVLAFLISAFAGYVPFWRLSLNAIERFAPTQSLMLKQQIMHIGMRKPIVPIALSSCLTLFLAIHIWGATLMEAFVPGNWLPKTMAHRPAGFSQGQLESFRELAEVQDKNVTGVFVEQVRLAEDLLGSKERATVTRQDNVLVVGLDPERTWGGAAPLLNVKWVLGNKEDGILQLKENRGCLVVDHFLEESGLAIGDQVKLVPPRGKPTDAVSYKIAGAVELPGWHWQTKHTAMRTRSHRTAAMIFVSDSTASQDYGLDAYSHLWFNQKGDQKDLRALTDSSASIFGSDAPVKMVTAESIRERVRQTSRQWLWIISTVPLIGLGIATLSFVQMQIASLRSRSWELGVVRALGFQKSEVIRVWIVEIGLILLFSLLHSFIFGWLVSYCAVHYSQQFSFFGGVDTPMKWPWSIFAWSLVFSAVIVFVGGFAPARLLLRKMPMQLLNSSVAFGRGK